MFPIPQMGSGQIIFSQGSSLENEVLKCEPSLVLPDFWKLQRRVLLLEAYIILEVVRYIML